LLAGRPAARSAYSGARLEDRGAPSHARIQTPARSCRGSECRATTIGHTRGDP
jgi:hypothetical protein